MMPTKTRERPARSRGRKRTFLRGAVSGTGGVFSRALAVTSLYPSGVSTDPLLRVSTRSTWEVFPLMEDMYLAARAATTGEAKEVPAMFCPLSGPAVATTLP
jgi:hypothetical protein